MKFLSGIESLQISARQDGDDWVLDGRMPWVTNLRPDGFLVAAAVTAPDGTPAVVALPQGIAGLTRSADLRLLGLQSSNTAALEVKGVRISPRWLIHADARQYLPQARPAFAGLPPSLVLKTELAAPRRLPPRRRHERRERAAACRCARKRSDAALSGADAAVFQDVNLPPSCPSSRPAWCS